ncbi:adventurous gliding motility protein GltJ [Anaeromyxobacter oryzae]|uniref:MJ0042 family finger-like protein n=1 Tax=Anaeromyxobacter oryzae TaxID=2918170 RepID=A0ABN6MVE1_9BACT|nr:adventurous gliding motility protein GltJ [Anaeromyxobacter oryzae]BDG04937.1 hypothetical protein AMOR_39330 [Anaeromyxobacter oryzae]
MKFTCERCDAQYMISDEKVGPNGVKVRCKKCSNVILVRRAVENGAVAAEAPARAAEAPAPAPGGTGEHALERELGHAFDQAFGDAPAPAAAPAPDLDATQGVSAEEAARIAAASAASASPPATEWYVAIGQAQVGPLPLAEVRRKWEAGDVGPDSLVWRPGMGDWAPLSSMSDLATYLAPVPQASRTPSRAEPAPVVARAEHAQPGSAAASASAAPAPEVTWKPVAASALAALASEEIAARERPEPRAEAQRPAPNGVKSLVEELPDGGGVDPTGAIPLPIKALERTDEQKIEKRSSVARGAEELRHKRSAARAVLIGAAAVVVVVAAAAVIVVRSMNQKAAPAVAAVTAPVAPAPAPAPPAAAPEPASAAPTPSAAAPAAVAAAPEAPRSAPAPEAVPAKAEPPPAPEPVAKAPEPGHAPGKIAHHEPVAPKHKEAPLPRKEKEPVRVAQASPPPAAAPPPPAPRPAAKKDSLLDFDGGGGGSDPALDEALGGGRKVYVPAAPGGGTVPQRLTDSQVNETILARVSALQQCVQEQKARDPGASGVLKMRWTIAPDGGVQAISCATPEYASSPIAQCLTGVLRGMKFPRSVSGRPDVTFPIKF